MTCTARHSGLILDKIKHKQQLGSILESTKTKIQRSACAMSIIEHHQEELDLSQTIHEFSRVVGFSKLSAHVFGRHHGKFSLLQIIEWLLTTKFLGRSLYRAQPNPRFTTRTARNYLNDSRTNWQRLTCLIAQALIKYLRPFIHPHRRLAFILDDTLFTRDTAQKTELLARTFDHDTQVYKKGFRALTLAWSDGDTLVPVNYALMSSKNVKNRIGGASTNQDGSGANSLRVCLLPSC